MRETQSLASKMENVRWEFAAGKDYSRLVQVLPPTGG